MSGEPKPNDSSSEAAFDQTPLRSGQVIGTSEIARSRPREFYQLRVVKLGIAEIVLGIASAISGMLTLLFLAPVTSRETHVSAVYTYPSQGLWGGVFLVALGICGANLRNKISPKIYKLNAAFGVMSAIFICAATSVSLGAAILTPQSGNIPLIACHVLATLALICGTIISIMHSIYSFSAICRKDKNHAAIQNLKELFAPSQQKLVQLSNDRYAIVNVKGGKFEGHCFNQAEDTDRKIPVLVPAANELTATVDGESQK